MDADQRNKAHKPRVKGAKAAKQELHRKGKKGLETQPNRGSNNRAFTGPSMDSRKMKAAAKTLERKENQYHMPHDDRTMRHLHESGEPPMLVAVVGPPGVGKSTLIRSMAKFYCNRTIRRLRGPVTVVAGRARRITFVEVPNTLAAMCDISKVADLVILMVDGSYGFEMETFEFLNIAQVHGFARIVGVVSHLDKLKTSKSLKKTKKVMRHRFWHEVSAGAKIHCLSPMVSGQYRSSDVLKLHRLLVTVECKPQAWRNTHSCVYVDRFEDVTDPKAAAEEPDCDRAVAMYGYVRGHPVKPGQMMHIPGVGDLRVAHVSLQEDPCEPAQSNATSVGSKMRHLSAKHKRVYAPYCDVAGMVVDDDAVYVYDDPDLAGVERSGAGLDMMRELQGARAMDEGAATRRLAVGGAGAKYLGSDDESDDESSGDGGRRRVRFANEETMELEVGDVASGSEAEDSDDSDDAADAAGSDGRTAAGRRPALDLSDFGIADSDGDDATGGAEESLAPRGPFDRDSVRAHQQLRFDWSDPEYRDKLKQFFVTGSWTAAESGAEVGGEQAEGAAAAAAGAAGSGGDSDGYASVGSDDQEFTKAAAGLSGSSDDGDDSDEEADDDDADLPALLRSGDGAVRKGRRGAAKRGGGSPPASCTGSDDGGEAADPFGGAFDALARGKKRGAPGSDSEADEDAVAPAVQQPDDVQGLLDFFISRDLEGGEDLLPGAGALGKASGDDEADAAEAADPDAAVAGGASQLTAEQEAYLKKKLAKKESFDEGYDADGGKNNTTKFYQHLLEEQAEKKRRLDDTVALAGDDVEKRIQLVGYYSGLYVRIVFEGLPVEFIRHHDPTKPLFCGGLNAGEDQMCVVQARLKRHRWYPRILKAQDPVVMSIGWRRVQNQPIFAHEDANGRQRYLKYTPKHMHCGAAFLCPSVPPNTGFCLLPAQSQRTPWFRLTATGYTTAADSTAAVVKKLKLTGTPERIQKTTAFVKGMFNSDIEAAKFVGAKVKAVSGIRGIIKKALKGKRGLVRCTFEDKLLPSDIVFLRAWKPVEPPSYCEPVREKLIPAGVEWQGMKTMAQIRRARGAPLKQNPDSQYRDVVRRVKPEKAADRPAVAMLSRNLRNNLPFAYKQDYVPLVQKTDLQQQVKAETAQVPTRREAKRGALLEAFRGRSEKLGEQRKEQRATARHKAARGREEDAEELKRKLKAAKKESAKRQDFKNQRKSRVSSGKGGGKE